MSAWDRAMEEARAVLRSDAGVPMPILLCVAWNEEPLCAGETLCFNIRRPPVPLLRDEPVLDITHVLMAIAEMFEPWPLPPNRREHVFQVPLA